MKYAVLLALMLAFAVPAMAVDSIVIGNTPQATPIYSLNNQPSVTYTITNDSLTIDDLQPFFMSIQNNFQTFNQEQLKQSEKLAALETAYAALDGAYGRLAQDWHDYIELRWNSMFIFFFAVAILIVVLTPLFAALMFNRIQEHFLSQFNRAEIKPKPQPPKPKRKWFGLRKGE